MAAFHALQPGDLVALLGDQRIQLRDQAKQFGAPRFQIGTRKLGRFRKPWHMGS